MTYAEEIALEHIAHRRRSGWSWAEIATEAGECCFAVNAPFVATLYPHANAPAWAIERAFALAYEATMNAMVAA